MSNEEFPYVNRMNALHESLQLIDVPSLVSACKDKWYNQTLCQVNDAVVRDLAAGRSVGCWDAG